MLGLGVHVGVVAVTPWTARVMKVGPDHRARIEHRLRRNRERAGQLFNFFQRRLPVQSPVCRILASWEEDTGRGVPRILRSPFAIRDAGALEGGHFGQQRDRIVHEVHRHRGPGTFAEPEVEIEQRREAEALEYDAVTDLD
ncbi:MAG: hypothetical protein QOF51_524 [Chloroflexota bacterium]|nr:hypothetical protein [Chloroflexota bacterium]